MCDNFLCNASFTGCRKALASFVFSAQPVFFSFPKCHQTATHCTVFSLLHLPAPEVLWSGAGLRAVSGVGITCLRRIRLTTAALRDMGSSVWTQNHSSCSQTMERY